MMPNFRDLFAPLEEQGQYLQTLANLEACLPSLTDPDERSMTMQILAAIRAFVGDTRGALETFDSVEQRDYSADPAPTLQENATCLEALPEILRAAQGRQIVILNEAHHVPRCRAFALPLALALRQQGFAYFAAETFGSDIQETVRKGYPNRGTGFYSEEPVFGDLVRQALRVGYRFVDYEARPPKNRKAEADDTEANNPEATNPEAEKSAGETRVETGADGITIRETAQARNLTERIFQNDPNARVFIYVGFSHLAKTWDTLPDGSIRAWMAARLKQNTGIDPLTIEQTEADEHSSPERETPGYREAIARAGMTRPSVFRNPDGAYGVIGEYSGKVDMQVFHPPAQAVQGRPDWLAMAGYRRPYALEPAWQPTSGRALAQAFVAAEPDEAIPMDQVLLIAGQPLPCLMLPTGRYRLMLQQEDGTTRLLANITQA